MKPILFSTAMVQAIIEGKKTQTRRVMRDAKIGFNFLELSDNMAIVATDKNGEEYPKDVDGLYATFEYDGYPEFPVIKSKYEIGDILWVRETFFCEPCTFDCAGQIDDNECPFNRVNYKCYGYKAQYTNGEGDLKIKWRPSIHMPREAARLFLRVTDVRVERLQDISDSDCRKEGIQINYTWWSAENYRIHIAPQFINAYHDLWDNLNNKRGYGWNTNPWVWVYEFEKCDKPE